MMRTGKGIRFMGLAQLKVEPLYTEEEYLALERAAEERSEYLDGAIYQMAGESPDHGKVSVNLVRIISTHLLDKDCDLFTKDMKVRSGPLPKNRLNPKGLFSYPDLVIVCGEMKFLDEYRDVLVNPTVIIEVLSETTERFNRKQKFLRYQKYLPTLTDYVLVSQDQPLVEIFHRNSSEWWQYTFVDDLTGALRIPSLDCPLRLAEIYRRVEFPANSETESKSNETRPRKRIRQKAKAAKRKPATRRSASPGKKKK